jgi:hypothetical protein
MEYVQRLFLYSRFKWETFCSCSRNISLTPKYAAAPVQTHLNKQDVTESLLFNSLGGLILPVKSESLRRSGKICSCFFIFVLVPYHDLCQVCESCAGQDNVLHACTDNLVEAGFSGWEIMVKISYHKQSILQRGIITPSLALLSCSKFWKVFMLFAIGT